MKNSLVTLLKKFPYFFKKSEDTNFYKSQSVTNNQFKNIYNDLFKVYESFKLDKRILIWREQENSYQYIINFVVKFPNLKSITLYKNDEVIYTELYNEDDYVDYFEYIYEGNTLNDVGDEEVAELIPSAQFKAIVETYDEYYLVKGYPENDVKQGNEFDHDESLDEIGAYHNIPRKQYQILSSEIPSEIYPLTEPPYNNKATEDDYYYMKRMLEYMVRYHTTPLPVLELWKLYSIDSKMENREKLLLKVFDEERHGGYGWVPEAWEHKDSFCNYVKNKTVYLFIQATTNTPLKNQDVTLTFILMDSQGQIITDTTYIYDIFVDDVLIKKDYSETTFLLLSEYLSQSTQSVIQVNMKNSKGEQIASSRIFIKIRGCDDADYFVSENGSDSNNGTTKETAFKTIKKASNSLANDISMIAILKGNYTITNQVTVNHSCTIFGCDNVVIENTTDNQFFKLKKGKELHLQNIKLRYEGGNHLIQDSVFTNKNPEGYLSVVVRPVDSYEIDINVPLIKNLTYSNNKIMYDEVIINDNTDLDGVVYGIEYVDNKIKYKEFEYTGEFTAEDVDNLRTAIISINYEDNLIKYNVVGGRI